jgi:diketogulonate reductase-like aldo/keto reductase
MAPAFSSGPRLPKTKRVLPSIGLGVYKSKPGEETYEAVLNALRVGYRHIDTAQAYGNEADVGRALADSGIPRKEVFITSKLFPSKWGYETARGAIKESLRKLNVACIDLFLLHAPGDPALRAETWRCLEDAQQEGILGDIGVSNFSERHLEKLEQTAMVSPAVNQIEVHPWLQRQELVRYCQEHGIIVEAYSPLAKASKLADPVVGAVAHRLGATPAQVLVAWSLAKGLVTLPKSTNPERQRENLEAAKIHLDAGDIKDLDGLEAGLVTGWDPIKDAPV